MRLWVLPSLLVLSLNAFAMEPDALPADTPEQRLIKCMDYLNTSFGQSISAKVIKVGPSLRSKFPGLSVKNAVVVMDFETVWGNILILRPISEKLLRASADGSINVSAGELHTLELSTEENYNFNVDSKQIGSITLTFESHESSKPLKPARAETIELGSILKIANNYFAVVDKTPAQKFGEHDIFQLAAFTEKPSEGKTSGQIHILEMGGLWNGELDGKYIIGAVSNLGRAVVDVQRRIGLTADPKFSSTIVQWKDDATIAPALRIENYQALSSGTPRLIEEHPNLATLIDSDPNLRKLLDADKKPK